MSDDQLVLFARNGRPDHAGRRRSRTLPRLRRIAELAVLVTAVVWYAIIVYVGWPWVLLYWQLWILAGVCVWLAFTDRDDRSPPRE